MHLWLVSLILPLQISEGVGLEKWVSLSEAVNKINDGYQIGLGGNALNRAPMALVFELWRQKKKNLRLVTTAGGLEVDLLCLAGLVESVDAAFISYETEFGLAKHYRKSVESGIVKANEHSCYTLICALRAACTGVEFMPIKGLTDSDLLKVCDYFDTVIDPFSGRHVNVVKKMEPDVSLIHADEADEMGNVFIEGPLYDDVLLSKASKKLIVSVERKVSSTKFRHGKRKPQIPGFLVSKLVHAPKGALPTSCSPNYGICKEGVKALSQIKGFDEIDQWIKCRNTNRAKVGTWS